MGFLQCNIYKPGTILDEYVVLNVKVECVEYSRTQGTEGSIFFNILNILLFIFVSLSK